MNPEPLRDVYVTLNPHARIRQNADGYYLSTQLHRKKVQLDGPQAELLSRLDGASSLAALIEGFRPEARSHLAASVLKLGALLYLDCFRTPMPRPDGPAALPDLPAPQLQEVHLDLTAECNLRCRHCYQLDYISDRLTGAPLSTAEWLGVFDQLRDLNVDRVNISGGEPLTCAELPTLIRGLYARGLKLSSIFTNGVLPIDPLLAFFDELPYPIDFSVSLDGPDAPSHERIRGRGTFAPTLRTIDVLSARVHGDGPARYSFDVNTCVFDTNVDRLEALYELVRAHGVPRWRLSLPRDEGAFLRNRDLEAPRPAAFAAYQRLLERYLRDYDAQGAARVPYLQIESIFRTSMLTRGEVYTFGPASSCCEYKRHGLALKPNGDVLGCTSFQSHVMGNVRTRPLRDIWYDARSQYLKQMPVSDVIACRDCRLLRYCGTGCRSNVFDRTASLTEKDELACAIYAFFDESVRPLLERYGIRYVA